MNDLFPTYNLYCTNMQCNVSIYKNTSELSLALTATNVLATHFCACCDKSLVSAIELEIEQMIVNAGIKIAARQTCDRDYWVRN